MTFSQSSESDFLFRDGSIVSQINPPQGPDKILMKINGPSQRGDTDMFLAVSLCMEAYVEIYKVTKPQAT